MAEHHHHHETPNLNNLNRALSTTENALTGHLIIEDNLSQQAIEAIKKELRHELEHQNIHHCTFEVETSIGNDLEVC